MRLAWIGCAWLMLFFAHAEAAALIEPHPSVLVMEFADHPDAAPYEISLSNVGKTASEFALMWLVEEQRFDVLDAEQAKETAKTEGLRMTGIVAPDTAKRLGRLTGAQYILYGTVVNVSVSSTGTETEGWGGVSIGTTKATVVIKCMDAKTGELVMGAKGVGKSKTSYTKIKLDQQETVAIGTRKVTQDSVTSALQKASREAVELLTRRLYGEEDNKQRE